MSFLDKDILSNSSTIIKDIYQDKYKLHQENVRIILDKINQLKNSFICYNFPTCKNDITIDIYHNETDILFNNTSSLYKEVTSLTALKGDIHCPYEYYNFCVMLRLLNIVTNCYNL